MPKLTHQLFLLAPVLWAGGWYCLSAQAEPPAIAQADEVVMQPVVPEAPPSTSAAIVSALSKPLDLQLEACIVEDALKLVSDAAGCDIVVDPAVSEGLGIAVSERTINLSLSHNKPTAGRALSLILAQVSSEIDYVIRDGVILVTTGVAAMETRVYDVAWAAKSGQPDVIFPPGAAGAVLQGAPEVPVTLAQFGGMGMGGDAMSGGGWGGMGGGGATTESDASIESLAKVVRDSIQLPLEAAMGNSLRVTRFGERLVVCTTRSGHDRVAELLKELQRYSQSQLAVPAPLESAPQAFIPAAP